MTDYQGLIKKGVPPAFVYFAAKHLQRSGYDESEFDIAQHYNSHASMQDNMNEFKQRFPHTLIRKKEYGLNPVGEKKNISTGKGVFSLPLSDKKKRWY